jgi:hypothetical protein
MPRPVRPHRAANRPPSPNIDRDGRCPRAFGMLSATPGIGLPAAILACASPLRPPTSVPRPGAGFGAGSAIRLAAASCPGAQMARSARLVTTSAMNPLNRRAIGSSARATRALGRPSGRLRALQFRSCFQRRRYSACPNADSKIARAAVDCRVRRAGQCRPEPSPWLRVHVATGQGTSRRS